MPLLKEPLDVLTVTALVLGIVWLFIELDPSKQMDFMGAACALVAAFFYAEHIVMTRYAAHGDRPLTVIFYDFLVGLLPPQVVFYQSFTAVRPEHLWLHALLCSFKSVAGCSIIFTLSYALASQMQAINQLRIVWTAKVGDWIFPDILSLRTIDGALLVVGEGLLPL